MGISPLDFPKNPASFTTTTVIWAIRNELDENRTSSTHVHHSAPNLVVVKERIRPGSMIEVTKSQFSLF